MSPQCLNMTLRRVPFLDLSVSYMHLPGRIAVLVNPDEPLILRSMESLSVQLRAGSADSGEDDRARSTEAPN